MHRKTAAVYRPRRRCPRSGTARGAVSTTSRGVLSSPKRRHRLHRSRQETSEGPDRFLRRAVARLRRKGILVGSGADVGARLTNLVRFARPQRRGSSHGSEPSRDRVPMQGQANFCLMGPRYPKRTQAWPWVGKIGCASPPRLSGSRIVTFHLVRL